MILDALRQGGGELSTAQIVSSGIAAGGHGEGAKPTMASRVRGNLAYLERRKKVAKIGVGNTARWCLRE